MGITGIKIKRKDVFMKAVILCGGEGSRLRPLTCNVPKPLTRLCGRPILSYILDRLHSCGVTEAALTVKYLADDIVNWCNENSQSKVRLTFFREDTPLGTAGSVGNCRDFIGSEDFFVVSGDALFDFDLSSAAEFHKKSSALATVVTSRVDDPREYGSVISGSDGRIEKFCEKPDWSQAVSRDANTGIYVLSPEVFRMIPDNTVFDFAGDLFPQMLSKKQRLFSYRASGYWCDIGSIESYKQCQFDILAKRAGNLPEAVGQDGVFCRGGKMPGGDFRIIPPVYFGSSVSVGSGASIGPYAVIDDNCCIGSGTSVRHSVMLENSYVGSNCELRGALMCKGSSAESASRMFEGSVVGSNSRVGAGAKISTNVLIWPDKLAESGACVNTNIKWGNAFAGSFDEDGISGEAGTLITPELCSRVGQALATLVSRGKIAVSHDGQLSSEIYCQAFASGVSSSGARLIHTGMGWDSLLCSFVKQMGFDAGVFFSSAGNRTSIHICGSDGLNLTRRQERKFDSILRGSEFARCGFDEYRPPEKFDGSEILLADRLSKMFSGKLSAGCRVTCCTEQMERFTADLLKDMGVSEGSVRFHIASSGHSLAGFDEENRFISVPRMNMLIAYAVLSSGEDLAVGTDAPLTVDMLAAERGRQVLRYALCPSDDSDAAARELAARQGYMTDAITGMLKLLSFMSSSGQSLHDIDMSAPRMETEDIRVSVDGNVQDAVKRLAERFGAVYESDGIRICEKDKDVYCRPTRRGNGIHICVRAGDMEVAKEFCAEIRKSL